MTIKHILLDSTDFQQIHEKYYNSDTAYTTSLTQSALILCDLLSLQKRLFYTINCDTFFFPILICCVNPFSYHLIHFILRGLALLGASYLIGDVTSKVFYKRVLILLEGPHLSIQNLRAGRDAQPLSTMFYAHFEKIMHHSSLFKDLLLSI